MRKVVRNSDLASRSGGDEFILLVAGGRQTGEMVAERIVNTMRKPITLDVGTACVSASIGGFWTPAKISLDKLVSRSYARLYEAKAAGKDRWRVA